MGRLIVRGKELIFLEHPPIAAAANETSDYEADSQDDRSEEKRVHKREGAQQANRLPPVRCTVGLGCGALFHGALEIQKWV